MSHYVGIDCPQRTGKNNVCDAGQGDEAWSG